jgi:hypothetical protein
MKIFAGLGVRTYFPIRYSRGQPSFPMDSRAKMSGQMTCQHDKSNRVILNFGIAELTRYGRTTGT